MKTSKRLSSIACLANICLTWLILANFSGSSRAQTVFDDGGTHTVNGPSGWIEVSKSTTLNIVSPASVSGTAPESLSAVSIDPTSTLNLSGGQVLNSANDGFGITSQGLFTATGGDVTGGTLGTFILGGSAQISGGAFKGQIGLEVNYANNVSISGGSFSGYNALSLYMYTKFTSTVTITGGIFTVLPGPPGQQLASLSDSSFMNASSTVNISGGVFNGPMSLFLYNDSTVNFFGTNLNFDPTSDLLTGTLANGDPLNVNVYRVDNISVIRSPDGDAITFIGTQFQAAPEPPAVLLAAISTLLISSVALIRACCAA